jgi:hypothetical protein
MAVFVGLDGTFLMSSRTSERASEEGSHATLPTGLICLLTLAPVWDDRGKIDPRTIRCRSANGCPSQISSSVEALRLIQCCRGGQREIPRGGVSRGWSVGLPLGMTERR